jgi:hypothetical protein
MLRRLVLLGSCFFAVSTVLAAPRFDSADGIPTFQIVAKHSEKCVDVQGQSREVGAKLIQYHCKQDSSTNQNFILRPIGGSNRYSIISQNSGLCLDIKDFSTDIIPVQQWTCNGGANQTFSFTPQDDDTFEIRTNSKGTCLDVQGASTDDDVGLIQYPCNNGDNQAFSLRMIQK